MRTVTRRELNQNSAPILERVLETGEPVEITSRGRASLIISVKPESLYDQWVKQGLVDVATRPFGGPPYAHSEDTVVEILDELHGDH